MLLAPSSVDSALDVAVERLAEKFAAAKVGRLQTTRPTLTVKQAEGFLDSLQHYGGQAVDAAKHYGGQAFDAARNYASQGQGHAGLLGAGIGALGGGLLGGVSGMMGPRDATGRKRTWSGALTGAMAGAGLGGGVGLLGHYMNEKGLLPGSGQGGGGSPDGAPSAPPGLIGRAANRLGNYYSDHPLLATTAALDAGNQGVGTIAEQLRPGSSTNPAHLRAGLARTMGEGGRYAGHIDKDLVGSLEQLNSIPAGDPRLRELMHAAQANRAMSTAAVPGYKGLTWGHIHELTREGSGRIRGGNMQDLANMRGRGFTGAGTGYVPSPVNPLASLGGKAPAIPELTKELPGPRAPSFSRVGGVVEDAKRLGPMLKRTLANQPLSARSATNGWTGTAVNAARRGLPRLALYGGLPLLEELCAETAPADHLKGFSLFGGN